MQTILSALLWFFKTMEGGRSELEKYYYFLLPNNRSIQVGAQYLTTCGKQRWQKVKLSEQPGHKHNIQIEKWKVSKKLFIYENLKRTTNF